MSTRHDPREHARLLIESHGSARKAITVLRRHQRFAPLTPTQFDDIEAMIDELEWRRWESVRALAIILLAVLAWPHVADIVLPFF